ncbi:MAG: hypothetical protein VKL59_03590 [Nostocaceae cyanobacterium]|nr:hypothetical protein [Nostocaceae cyanobacterium]
MKRWFVLISIASTLFIIQACSSQVTSKETPTSASPVSDKNHHGEHSMGEADENKSPDSHQEHTENTKVTQAKLTVPANITATKPISLVIDVQDLDGKPIANFETFQEKLMHLIVVTDDLQYFSHLHPNYQQKGRFEVQATFPKPGGYTLFSDYKPAQKPEQVSVLKTQIPGTASSPEKLDLTTTKTFGNTKVILTASQAIIKAGEEVNLMFNLQNTANNQPVTDLQSYLGERGHLVIIKQSSPLTEADYIHSHAIKDSPTGEVHFMTSFPKPGKYKLWGQFNLNGKIITADFWVNVV